MFVRERFRPQPMAADSAFIIRGINLGGFLATVAGTITVTDPDGTVIVNACPLVAGAFTPLPFIFTSANGAVVQLGGGAAGTLGI